MERSTRISGIIVAALLLAGGASLEAQQTQALADTAKPAVNDAKTAANGGKTTVATAGQDGVEHRPPAERNPRYKICPSDVIKLSFPLSPELNQQVTVQPDGYVNLQSVGGVLVAGLTVPQTVDAVKKAYLGTLHDPIIDVDLIDFQKPYFLVHGQVTKPGQYNLRNDLTVSQAIAVAGGFNANAKTQVFLYHRINDTTMEAKELKLKDILHGKNVNEDVQIHPGDVIFVPEKFITKFRKYVPYYVGTGMTLDPTSF
jgi:protein involved in polysaccharide export with SLBB domain